MSVRVEWLTVGGPVEPWQRLGLTVVDGTVPLFGTGIRIDESLQPGLRHWELSGLDDAVTDDRRAGDGRRRAGDADASPTTRSAPSGSTTSS